MSTQTMHATDESLSQILLSQILLEKMDAYWRAANYLSLGQCPMMKGMKDTKKTSRAADKELHKGQK